MGSCQFKLGPVQLLLQQLLVLLMKGHLLHSLLEEHVPWEAGADRVIRERQGPAPWRL
jgi:hypothetical protein